MPPREPRRASDRAGRASEGAGTVLERAEKAGRALDSAEKDSEEQNRLKCGLSKWVCPSIQPQCTSINLRERNKFEIEREKEREKERERERERERT